MKTEELDQGHDLLQNLDKESPDGEPGDETLTPKENTMTTPVPQKPAEAQTPSRLKDALGVAASEGKDAAWRTAASQLVKLTRDSAAAALCRHLSDDSPELRAKVSRFLQTEIGTAVIAAFAAVALQSLPAKASGPAIDRLSKELRIKAMADLGDVAAETLMGPLRMVIALYLQDPAGIPSLPAELTEGFPSAAAEASAPEAAATPKKKINVNF